MQPNYRSLPKGEYSRLRPLVDILLFRILKIEEVSFMDSHFDLVCNYVDGFSLSIPFRSLDFAHQFIDLYMTEECCREEGIVSFYIYKEDDFV